MTTSPSFQKRQWKGEHDIFDNDGRLNRHTLHTLTIQMVVVKGPWTDIRPTNSLNDENTVDFEILCNGSKFLDSSNTFIKMTVRVTTPD